MIYDKIKSEKGLKMHIKVFSWSLNGYLSLFLAHLGDTDPFGGTLSLSKNMVSKC